MTKDKLSTYKEIFRRNRGILRASTAIKLGVPEYIIYEMHARGELIKESRGLYRLAESEPLGNPDLVQVSLRIPKSVICLISALYFHGYTTEIPHHVYVSLPRDTKKPRLDYPPLKVFRRSDRQFSTGIEEHTIDGVIVRVYDREKTITDCFKHRHRIGSEVALEALKEYMHQPDPNVQRIIEYAKINRVERLICPYLETLL